VPRSRFGNGPLGYVLAGSARRWVALPGNSLTAGSPIMVTAEGGVGPINTPAQPRAEARRPIQVARSSFERARS